MHGFPTVFLYACLAASGVAVSAAVEQPCTGFKWNVDKEHSLFVGSSTAQSGAKESRLAPTLETDHLYDLELTPQDQVTFTTPPAKKLLSDGAYAGITLVALSGAGLYRVSIDSGLWIDLIADGHLVATHDFQGRQSCATPRKIVEYDVPAAQRVVLQLSNSAQPRVKLTITRTPAAPQD